MIESGYSRYACDRAEAAHEGGAKPIEFHKPEDKAAAEWAEVEYADGHGVAMRMTLCPACAAKYRSIEATHARDMEEFANEGMWS